MGSSSRCPLMSNLIDPGARPVLTIYADGGAPNFGRPPVPGGHSGSISPSANRSPSTPRTGVPRLQVTAEATGPAGRSPKETHAKPNRLRKNGFWQSEVSCPRGGDVLSGPESRFAAPGYGPEGDQQGAGRARETPLGAVLPRPITPLERSESSSATPGSPSAPGCRP